MTEREREQRAKHRLAVIRHAQEVTHNVAKSCRYYGITRTAYCKWLRRYEAGGLEALKDGSTARMSIFVKQLGALVPR